MIVVVGAPAWRDGGPGAPGGRACEVALAAARAGGRVELVGRAGDDPVGDRLLIALARAGVGHAAVLRDPARPTPVLPPVADSEPVADAPFADPPPPGTAPAAAGPPGPRLQPADVSLGLQYLTAFVVIVIADDVPAEVVPACVDGAAFAGAHLVALVAEGREPPAGLPDTATVIAIPPDDDGAVAGLVGRYAARLDAGEDPAAAFQAALDESWETPAP